MWQVWQVEVFLWSISSCLLVTHGAEMGCLGVSRGWAAAGALGGALGLGLHPTLCTLAPDKLGVALWPQGDSSSPVPPTPSSEPSSQSAWPWGPALSGARCPGPIRASVLMSHHQALLILLCAPTSQLYSWSCLLLNSDGSGCFFGTG